MTPKKVPATKPVLVTSAEPWSPPPPPRPSAWEIVKFVAVGVLVAGIAVGMLLGYAISVDRADQRNRKCVATGGIPTELNGQLYCAAPAEGSGT